MQRIIPFGRDYAESAEFSVDEGQTIRFWLVREDHTTTPGHHAFAELQVRSAVGSQHWTTLHVMDGDKPYHDLIGVDDNLIYRWVRKDISPSIAVDRSQDGAYSRTQRAPVDATTSAFNPADPDARAYTIKLLSAAGPDTLVGVHEQFSPDTDDPSEFGEVLSRSGLIEGATSEASITITFDPATSILSVEFKEDVGGDGDSFVDWPAYAGGSIQLFTECFLGGFSEQYMNWTINDGDNTVITETGLLLTEDLSAEPLIAARLAEFIAVGKTFFFSLVSPNQTPPGINLGPRTGRFMLDQNDINARLSASPFDPGESVTLSAVESGGVVIPLTYDEDGDPIRLVPNYRSLMIEAPGEYEWRRSCNSAPGVYLNTGWRQ